MLKAAFMDKEIKPIDTSQLNEVNLAEFGFKCIKPKDYNEDTDRYIKVVTVSGERYDEIRALLANDPALDVSIVKYVEIRPMHGYDINKGMKITIRYHKNYLSGDVVFKGVVDNIGDFKTLLRLLELS